MPASVGKSGLMALLGERGRKALLEHRGDETQYGIINLPPGISGGVAQLVMARWGRFKDGSKNQGKPFVTLQGIAVSPVEHNGVRVKGQRVSQTIPLCDTEGRSIRGEPGTLENWFAELLNELRKLGIETESVEPDDIEGILAMLEDEQQGRPYFRFSTRGWTPPKRSPSDPEPTEMVFTQFDGLETSYGEEDSQNGEVSDDSGTPDESESEATKPVNRLAATARTLKPAEGRSLKVPVAEQLRKPTVGNGPQRHATSPSPTRGAQSAEGRSSFASVRPGKKSAPPPEPEPEEEVFDEFGDLDSLAEQADADQNSPAVDRLLEMAAAIGISDEDVKAVTSWAEVAQMIREGSGEDDQDGAPEDGDGSTGEDQSQEQQEVWVPIKGQTCNHQVLDPRTKKPMVDPRTRKVRPPSECIIEGVDQLKQTVTLKALDSGAVYKGVPWDQLLGE